MAGPRLQFCTDPGRFLAEAGDHLAADPVVSTVVTTVAHRSLSQPADGIPQPDRYWWLVVRDESGAVVGAGMRTAPFAPYPLFLLPCPTRRRWPWPTRYTSAGRRCSRSTVPFLPWNCAPPR